MKLTIETDREDDGRWIAEVPELAGVLAYGVTQEEAMAKAEALALRVLAEQLDHGEAKPIELSFAIAAE
jgi:predicted RNase H-like HicB family nuclease